MRGVERGEPPLVRLAGAERDFVLGLRRETAWPALRARYEEAKTALAERGPAALPPEAPLEQLVELLWRARQAS